MFYKLYLGQYWQILTFPFFFLPYPTVCVCGVQCVCGMCIYLYVYVYGVCAYMDSVMCDMCMHMRICICVYGVWVHMCVYAYVCGMCAHAYVMDVCGVFVVFVWCMVSMWCACIHVYVCMNLCVACMCVSMVCCVIYGVCMHNLCVVCIVCVSYLCFCVVHTRMEDRGGPWVSTSTTRCFVFDTGSLSLQLNSLFCLDWVTGEFLRSACVCPTQHWNCKHVWLRAAFTWCWGFELRSTVFAQASFLGPFFLLTTEMFSLILQNK